MDQIVALLKLYPKGLAMPHIATALKLKHQTLIGKLPQIANFIDGKWILKEEVAKQKAQNFEVDSLFIANMQDNQRDEICKQVKEWMCEKGVNIEAWANDIEGKPPKYFINVDQDLEDDDD